ncbi:MAG: substrate-binding domain-containing protein [Verrucomicrobiae bacterium]|nr:substrate-binding domain-containing protein [Verrucomicrobiae bacterium]
MKKTALSGRLFPKRESLAERTAASLRLHLQAGKWSGFLPTERELCKLSQVSRPIMRTALHLLQKEGLLQIWRRRPTLILPQKYTRTPVIHKKQAVILTWQPLHEIDQWHLLAMDEIRQHLHVRGWQCHFVADLRLRWKNPHSILQKIAAQHDAACWVLASQPANVQKWFQDRKLRAVIMGSAFKGIHFPSIDDDFRAICRHAAGVFLGLGHVRIAYFCRQPQTAGDLASEQGFSEAFESSGIRQATPTIIRHCGIPDRIRAHIRKLFALPHPPTSILVSHAMDALTILTCLQRMNIRSPENVSLISRSTNNLFDHVTPAIAHYSANPLKHAKMVCQLIEAIPILLNQPRHIRIFPTFMRGETLAPPSSSQ